MIIILSLPFLIFTLICCIAILIINKTKIVKEQIKKNRITYVIVGSVIGAFIASNFERLL